jgi:hypothetical protein
MGLISLGEYAKKHGRDPSGFRAKAIQGKFQTAKKIGNMWVIDEDEVYIDHRITSGKYVDWRKPKKEKV